MDSIFAQLDDLYDLLVEVEEEVVAIRYTTTKWPHSSLSHRTRSGTSSPPETATRVSPAPPPHFFPRQCQYGASTLPDRSSSTGSYNFFVEKDKVYMRLHINTIGDLDRIFKRCFTRLEGEMEAAEEDGVEGRWDRGRGERGPGARMKGDVSCVEWAQKRRPKRPKFAKFNRFTTPEAFPFLMDAELTGLGSLPSPIPVLHVGAAGDVPAPTLKKYSDYLFTIYASSCFPLFPHPESACLLEGYYTHSLSAPLLYSALAWSALHAIASHAAPFTPHHLQEVSVVFYEKATHALAEVFDIPSEDTVLALINLHLYEQASGRRRNKAGHLHHAVAMARALKLEKEERHERNPIRLETGRRLWYALCLLDLTMVFHEQSTPMIAPDLIRNAPRPNHIPGESEDVSLQLVNLMVRVEFFLCLVSLPDPLSCLAPVSNINFAVSDFLQRVQNSLTDAMRAATHQPQTWHAVWVMSLYWDTIGQLWWRVLRIAADSEGQEEEWARLKETATRECAKTATNLAYCIQKAARLPASVGIWCKYTPINSVKLACELAKHTFTHHPDVYTRENAFRQLVGVKKALLAHPNGKCEVSKRLLGEITEAIRTIKATGRIDTEDEEEGWEEAQALKYRTIVSKQKPPKGA
ncbi:uncharacterized protein VTP21DRAFT_11431 [Calcarisporiella thermophila]|uniref:uncharacterized protein n=1 Tax=Calcarisporiella thermophila TaxID=911321 RepID=UPI003743A29D